MQLNVKLECLKRLLINYGDDDDDDVDERDDDDDDVDERDDDDVDERDDDDDVDERDDDLKNKPRLRNDRTTIW